MWRELVAVFSLMALPVSALSQPEVVDPEIDIRPVVSVPPNAVRLIADPLGDNLFFLLSSGDIYRVDVSAGNRTLVWNSSSHGFDGNVLGFAAAPDGSLFVVGNVGTAETNMVRVMRGTPTGTQGDRDWTLFAESEPYPRSGTAFDHLANGAIVSQDGRYLFVNSGSRTDHGEVQNRNGTIDDLREVPITSAILRLPLDAAAPIVIRNDADSLAEAGFLFADGVRNSFDLAFGRNNRLFATENSGDRDDGDELNWIREGHHYGFPWRMGGNATPMQFSGYDPAEDLLLNPSATAVQGGYFYDDPDYPPPPVGVVFTDPLPNSGPDGGRYRDATTGAIVDAGASGDPTFTFTPHRSPLGLAIDTTGTLRVPYKDAGFVLSWTDAGSGLLGPFNDPGEDLLKLTFIFNVEGNEESIGVTAEQIATGFLHPIDAVLVADKLYILEMVFGGTGTLWELTFPSDSGTDTESSDSRSTAALSIRMDDLYPNPATDEVYVEIRTSKPTVVALDLFDAVGRRTRILAPQLIEKNVYREQVDVHGLAAGTYFLRAYTAGQSTVASFVVTR